jgi:hypothetical protein
MYCDRNSKSSGTNCTHVSECANASNIVFKPNHSSLFLVYWLLDSSFCGMSVCHAGADEIASIGGPSTASEWLSNTNLMDQLLDTLVAPKERTARAARIQRAAQQNVGEILVHIARHECAPMFSQLTASSYLARMLEAAAAPESEVLQPVCAPRVLGCGVAPNLRSVVGAQNGHQ